MLVLWVVQSSQRSMESFLVVLSSYPTPRTHKPLAYLYRAIDEHGQLIDVFLRAHRDLDSAKAFLAQAIERRGSRQRR